MVVCSKVSVASRRARTNSRAVLASRPRVELTTKTLILNDESKNKYGYALVPSTNARARGQTLRDRNAFLLSATNSTNSCVANRSVKSVFEAEYCCEGASDPVCEGFPGRRDSVSWGTSRSGEVDGLLDGKSWEMNVVFGTILDVATKMLRQLLRRKGIVTNIPADCMIFLCLVGERLQKCAASRSRITKNDLARFSGENTQ